MSTTIRQRARQRLTFCPLSSFVYSLLINFHLNVINYKQFYDKQKLVWFCYLVVFICTLLFLLTATCLNFFFVKNNAVQYR